MNGTEDMIKRILALRPRLAREDVERRIKEEQEKAAGLLTEEAAAHLVASSLGLEGVGERIEAKLRIGDLTSGLNDVSFTARVIHVFPAHTFSRKDGREGKVLRMLVGDSTGSVSVVFWDDKVDHVIASKISPGKLVRILHGYTRERRGEIEVNMGNRGVVYLEPLDVVEGDFPEIASFFITPGEVRKAGTVNMTGVVVDRFPVSTFTRQDGTEGKVSRLVLEEGGGRINLVLWDDKVDEFGQFDDGTRIRLLGGRARERDDGSIEVHTGWMSEFEVVEEGAQPLEPVPHWTKLADLRNGMRGVNVVARVAQIGDEREFMRADGSMGRVASVLLEDETGSIRLSLWNEGVEVLAELGVDSVLSVENAYTRVSLGTVGLNVGENTKINVEPEGVVVEEISMDEKIVSIQDLKEGQMNVTIRGHILDYPEVREVNTVRGPATVGSFRLDDNTGEVRVSVWRDLVDEVEGLTPGALVRIENCNVRPPFEGLMQISSGIFTRIIVERK
jgi:ssDNA-binding replication factor A large subunit